MSCTDGPEKKKACKNCTCGLAEELETEVKGGKTTVKTAATSSCGNVSFGVVAYWLATCQNQSIDRIFWFWFTN